MIGFHEQLPIIAEQYETAELQDNLEHSGGISLSWKSRTDDEIPLGAYITYEGIRYVLLEPYAPTKAGPTHYTYNPTFKHPQNLLDRIPFWIKSRDSEGKEIALRTTSYTGFPGTIAQKLVDFFAEYAGTGDEFFRDTVGTDWAFDMPFAVDNDGRIIDTHTIITVGFDGCTIKSAATAIADAMGCNVFFDWNKNAEGKRVIRFVAGSTISGESYTHFHVLGGTTNMGKSTTSGSYSTVTQRLTLPEEYPGSIISLGQNAQNGIRLTKDLIFDDIYPKMELYIKSTYERKCYLTDENGDFIVDEWVPASDDEPAGTRIVDGKKPVYKTFSKWYIQLAVDQELTQDYDFDQSLLINDQPLCILFQIDYRNPEKMSNLVGRQFELTYIGESRKEWDKTDVIRKYDDAPMIPAKSYRIAYVAEGDTIIPTSSIKSNNEEFGLVPQVGDKVTLVNMALGTAEKELAQQELLAAAQEIIALTTAKSGEYTETMFFKDVEVVDEETGQTSLAKEVVHIGDETPFEKDVPASERKHGPVVTAISQNLDTGVAEVTVGSWSRKTRTGGMADKIETVTVSAASPTTGGQAAGGSIGDGGGYNSNNNSNGQETIQQTLPKPDALFVAGLDSYVGSVSCYSDGKVKKTTNIVAKVSAHYGNRDVTEVCNLVLKSLIDGVTVTQELTATIDPNEEEADVLMKAMSTNKAESLVRKKYVRIHMPEGLMFPDAGEIKFVVNHPLYGDRDATLMLEAVKPGESITKKSETYRYATNNTGTRPSASSSLWGPTKPTLNKGYWLYTETTITWSDNSQTVLYTDERNPNDGIAGQDIIVDGSTEVTYCVSDTNTSQPADSEFKAYSQITPTKGKWLWAKATTYYRKSGSASGARDAGSSSNYTVSYIARDGEAGRGVSKITEYYKATNSKADMAVPTSDSGWSTDPNLSDLTDKWDSNHIYLWNFEKVEYTKGTTIERTKPQILAIWTKDGKGIDSIVNYYKITADSTIPKRIHEGGTGWDDNPIVPTADSPFLWNYEVIYFTEGDPTYTDVQLLGHYGRDGKSPKVSINANGYWVIDGVNTGVLAEGKNGKGIAMKGVCDVLYNSQKTGKQTSLEGTTAAYGECYSVRANGHLYFFDGVTDDGSAPIGWLDMGEFKGQDGAAGKDSYMHIAYAAWVNISNGEVTAVTGFSTDSQGNDYAWTGFCTDNTEADPGSESRRIGTGSDYVPDARMYKWNYMKGRDGNGYERIYLLCKDGFTPTINESSGVGTKEKDEFRPAVGNYNGNSEKIYGGVQYWDDDPPANISENWPVLWWAERKYDGVTKTWGSFDNPTEHNRFVRDGKSQPSYIEYQEAWGNSVAEPPTTGWQSGTPSKSGTYLWRRSRTMTFNATTRAYDAGEWGNYVCLSGTNGTSIETKGNVESTNYLLDKQVRPYVNGATQQTAVAVQDGWAYINISDGHLYQWSDEQRQKSGVWSSWASGWLDLGKFQGDAGKTYYTHLAWANGITLGTQLARRTGQKTTPNAVSCESFHISPLDGYDWMGVLIDEVEDDAQDFRYYTWKKAVGEDGADGRGMQYITAKGGCKKADGTLVEGSVTICDGTNTTTIKATTASGSTKIGHVLFVINKSDLSVVSKTFYATYNNTTQCTALANAMTGADSSQILVLISHDSIGWNTALVNALKACGAGDFEAKSGSYPFAFIGYNGLEEGYASYIYGDLQSSKTADVTVPLADGSLFLIKNGKNGQAASYYQEEYARSDSSTEHYYHIDTGTGYSNYDGEWGWTADMPSKEGEYIYIWKRSRLFNPNNNTAGSWNYVCLTGDKGSDGEAYTLFATPDHLTCDSTSLPTNFVGGNTFKVYVTCNGVNLTQSELEAKGGSLSLKAYLASGRVDFPDTIAIDTDYTAVARIVRYDISLTLNGEVVATCSVPIVRYGDKGANGQNGTNGSDGLQGCVIRVSEYSSSGEYRNDEGNSSVEVGFIDVVGVADSSSEYGYNFYQVKKSDTVGSSRITSSQPPGSEWVLLTNVGPIFTSLLIAKYAYIKFGTGNQFVITNVSDEVKAGMKGDGDIRFWAGSSAAASGMGNNSNDGLVESSPFRVYDDGRCVMTKADVTGTITANAGYIGGTGGWVIDTNKIYKGTLGSDDSLFMSTVDMTSTINGASRTGLRFTIGSKFGVTSEGKLYAVDGEFSGKITATEGTIGGFKISSDHLGDSNDDFRGLYLTNERIDFYQPASGGNSYKSVKMGINTGSVNDYGLDICGFDVGIHTLGTSVDIDLGQSSNKTTFTVRNTARMCFKIERNGGSEKVVFGSGTTLYVGSTAAVNSATFTTADGKTVRVSHGLITSVT